MRDVDYLAGLREAAAGELDGLLQRAEVGWPELAGRVRSLTFRARKQGRRRERRPRRTRNRPAATRAC